jgi:cytochrome d ubiquinol oxidase subunit I
MQTRAGVSPGVSPTSALLSLIALTVLYAVLAVVEFGLLGKYVRAGAEPYAEPPDVRLSDPRDDDAPLVFAY